MKNSSIGGHGNAPGVSVLMPAHNSEKTIFRAIESTLKALNADSELIICLDGCTDRTQEIVLSFNDERIKVITNSRSEGVAQSLNKLLSVASKPYVARMDSDDICFKGRFQRQVRLIEQANVDLVFGNCILFSIKFKLPFLIPQIPFGLSPQQSQLALLMGCPFVHSTLLAKRECLIELDGYRNLAAEDYDLWLRAASAGKSIIRSRSYEVFYRRHAAQISKSRDWREKANSQEGLVQSAVSLSRRLGYSELLEKTRIADFNSSAFELLRSMPGIKYLELFRLAGVSRFLKQGLA